MAAQAKPSVSFDSSPTALGGGGSFFVPQTGALAGGNADAAAAAGNCQEGEPLSSGVAASLPLGLYVHVPFCSSTCDFCAFYQEKPKRQSIDLYLEAVAAELAQVRRELERGVDWLWQGESQFPIALPASPPSAGTLRPVPGTTSPPSASTLRPGPDAGKATGIGAPPAGVGAVCPSPTVFAGGRRSFTVFFGGGTPGLLPAADLGRLCGMVRQTLCDFGDIVEWSIELAPATVRPDRVKVLLEHGVNRFSLGVQSFADELLEALGRQHSRKQIFAAFETLRACGAKNISCDLMFALPGQTREAWLTDLQTLADLEPEHISTYCLTFEEDTAMWVKLSQGRYKLDPEHEADLYRETWAWLAQAGYAQYEVSNFARPGFRSRHNLATWSMGRWRGVGPSAASQWGGWRFQNPANLEGWAGAVLATERALTAQTHVPRPHWPPLQSEERVQLGNRLLAADALIFGLRRRDGVDRAQWLCRFAGNASVGVEVAAAAPSCPSVEGTLPLEHVEALFARFHAEGLLDPVAFAAGLWRLSDEGLLLADAIGGQLLECFEETESPTLG